MSIFTEPYEKEIWDLQQEVKRLAAQRDELVDSIACLCACLQAACAYPATAHAWATWKAEIAKATAVIAPAGDAGKKD